MLLLLTLFAGHSMLAGPEFRFSNLDDSQKEMLRSGKTVFLPGKVPEDMRLNLRLTYAKGDDSPVGIIIETDCGSQVNATLPPTGSWRKTTRTCLSGLQVDKGSRIGIRLEGTACSLRLLELLPDEHDPRLTDLLYSAIGYYDELLRLPNGAYQNVYNTNKRPISTGSTATIGVGLISLCINHELGRDPDAARKALETLRMLNGKGDLDIGRDKETGFFLHFFNNSNGSGSSEFSTIDTSIMLAGALCCRNTFNDDRLAREVDELFYSIDWSVAVADRKKMTYYTIIAEGAGQKPITQLFNEYLILAWLCHEYEKVMTGSSNLMPDMEDLPVLNYNGLRIPTERRKVPLSSFVVQFPFYMCDPAANDPLYKKYMAAYAEADHTTCRDEYGKDGFWGCGAGQTPEDGYVASSFLDNPGQVVSPRIIAGYMPVYPVAVDTLLTYYDDPARQLDTRAGVLIPRFSMKDSDWRPGRIESIDFSSMLFGTAAMHPDIGLDFFKKRFRFTAKPPR